jgi:hypothetical protein
MAFITQQAKTVDTTALDIATADSRDCAFCCGQGITTVYAPGYNGNAIMRDSNDQPYSARTVAHCFCPLGRFIRAKAPEDVRRRTPEVDMVAQGRSLWSLVDPTESSLYDSTSNVDEASQVTPDAFLKFWRRVRVSRVAKPIP